MKIIIRDWNKHFEYDRSKQIKNLRWVPIPNKQGSGYRKIMSEPNGLEIFACWIAIVEVASTCTPRGDLSKYGIDDLSRLTLINVKKLDIAVRYLSQAVDWIEVTENHDINGMNNDMNVDKPDINVSTVMSCNVMSCNVMSCSVPNNTDLSSDVCDRSTVQWRLAEIMVEDIQEWNKSFKTPSPAKLSSWAETFEKIHRIDKRPWHWINTLLGLIKNDWNEDVPGGFKGWRNFILSPGKLRENINSGKLDALIAKIPLDRLDPDETVEKQVKEKYAAKVENKKPKIESEQVI